jgi:hypothetical protein
MAVKGTAVIVGNIEVVEPDGDTYNNELAMLVVFKTAEDIREALDNGIVEIKFGKPE